MTSVTSINQSQKKTSAATYDVIVVGGGAAGLSVINSLLKRKSDLNIVLIDPADVHYYQPGWTMVGGGVFSAKRTVKTLASLIPSPVKWIKSKAVAFDPDKNQVYLENRDVLAYRELVLCPGLQLDWDKIEGLEETLGKNGVTSNYRFDLAPYTWELVKNTKHGKAIFTQAPLPIKCPGAPQKALYLSADYWVRQGRLSEFEIEFYSAGQALFSVADYVPALMKYIERYKTKLNFSHNLIKVDGKDKKAWFRDSEDKVIETNFDLLHVVPPQSAPPFIKESNLIDQNGWVDVDPKTLRHNRYQNIYALGDVANTPNSKTAAAARVQALVVAENILFNHGFLSERSLYNGYGACPLTVERGKVVLAEFGYGGKILNSFPTWLFDGKEATREGWFLKSWVLPQFYWHGMLNGYEWLIDLEKSSDTHLQDYFKEAA